MKKTSFITAAFLLMGMLFGSQAMAQGRIDFRSNSAQQCANVTEDGFTATFSFSGIQADEMNTEKGVFSNITMDGTYPTGNVGEPSLPAAHQLIAVPYGAKVASVEVKSFNTTTYRLADYGINTIMPQQPSVRKDQKPEDVKFVYDEKAYAKSMSQRPIASFEMKGTMRGIQVGSLVINPVNYNPATNSIEVYNDIEIEVRYDNYDKAASYNEFARTFSPYFASVYRMMFNWRDDVYDLHPDLWQSPVKMLVIADRMFEDCMQEWIAWKTMKGFYMDVNYTDEIGTSASAIRTFIQGKYAEDAPTFVIIFGDKNQVAGSATGSESHCITDLQYMSVDNDDFPDIYHSRMCAETVQQMQNIITKTLWYERLQFDTPTTRSTDYLGKVLLIAGWDSNWNPKVGKPTIQYAMEYYYNAEHGFTEVNYFLQQPYSQPYASLNTGVGFVNYTAHGSNSGWADPSLSVSDVNNLTNEGMPFLAMGNCCEAADWGISGTCFGEAMIRANTRAAYAYIGSCPSTYWWEDYYFGVGATNVTNQMPTFEQTAYGCYDAVWNDAEFNCVSAIPFIGNIAVCYAHAGSYQGSVSDRYYWQSYHALGDGSVMPFRIEPTPNSVSHMPTLPIGVDYFTISAEPGSYAAISKDGVLYGAGLIGEEGSADIAIEPIQSGGDVTICVTGLDKIPYIVTIPAASLEGAYIVYNNVQCENPVYGAYVNPTVTLKNVGVEAANDITVTLSTESEYIDLINATATVANIAPDATFDITDFTFDVAVNIPDNTKVQFFVTCVSGDNTWESKFNIIFSAPKFVTANIFNTELTAGGTGTATFQFTNNGGAEAQNAVFEVYSSSDDLVLESNTFEIGAIASGETVEIPVNITVGSNVELGSTYELSYLMSAGHYAISGSYIITVGNIIEGFETGDFSTYNWQFGGSSNWTVVNTGAYNGTYCAKSGAISDSQQTDLILTTEVLADGEISFYKKVSSENNYDKLYFYIDNQEKGNWSGDVAWSQTSFPVTAGTHTFKWSYKKDYSMSSGSDCAWIDDIQFPSTNVELALAPVTDLMAEVDDHIVTLTWEASEDGFEYIVRRNGEVIATTITLTISDIVPEDGIYTYSVVATNDEGLYSAPEYVTVNVGTVGVEENTLDNVSIYPNPVNDMLIINGGNAEFDYVMYNGMGQMVANGTANGTVQVNVSGMAKGVYFLRLNTGSQVRIDKVIVK